MNFTTVNDREESVINEMCFDKNASTIEKLNNQKVYAKVTYIDGREHMFKIRIFQKEGGFFVKCNKCTMVYLDPVFKDKELIKYYKNNIGALENLLENIDEEMYFIFSSSCTVYGQADIMPIKETLPIKKSESPYGETKQICEGILKNFCDTNPLFHNIFFVKDV